MCVVTVDCCTGSLCWCFTSNGLNTVSQDEIVFVLRCEQDENRIPRDVFYLFKMLYQHAAAGGICSPSVHSYSKNKLHMRHQFIRTTPRTTPDLHERCFLALF